ncbi:MAG: glucose-6-phosphate dehydrogenase [Phycisphaeraceae bacterium]|nr:glucose-6-phosphate dehydrogenase [Phycisphaeraceae bacterium]
MSQPAAPSHQAAAPSDALVFFGATGDLAFKQIIPSLQSLIRRGKLDIPIIGVAKAGWNLEQMQARVKESLQAHSKIDPKALDKFLSLLCYIDGDYRDVETFKSLKQKLGGAKRPLHYLAIPPSFFGTVVEGLAKAGCAADARVVVEKPFGRDLASARALNATLQSVFPEESIFRIDHYLGKEPSQNLLYFRFANPILEPVWNRLHIASIQITMAESFGVKGRGKFYEEAGAIRDVIQNHMLQVAALLTMDAPVRPDPAAIRGERTRLFEGVRTMSASDVVRGQFRGYRSEDGVATDSTVETYAAVRLWIDTLRWSGVPILIRAGKCLPETSTEVMVFFKRPPPTAFGDGGKLGANNFRFRLSPDVVIGMGARAKKPGEGMDGEAIELIAKDETPDEMPPYERLLGDAANGDSELFASQSNVEEAWRIVDPILGDASPVHQYDPGTWGPAEASRLTEGFEAWHAPAAHGANA